MSRKFIIIVAFIMITGLIVWNLLDYVDPKFKLKQKTKKEIIPTMQETKILTEPQVFHAKKVHGNTYILERK